MFFFGKPNVERMRNLRDIQGLIKALGYQKGKDSKDIRSAATEALGEMKDRRAVEPLITALLHDDHPHVREGAARALGKLGDVRAVEPLLVKLKDAEDYDYVRASVAEALGALGDTRAVEPLVATLTIWEVSKAAAVALDRLGWQPGNDESAVRYWLAKEEWEKCAALGEVAVQVLISILGESANYGSFAQSMLSLEHYGGHFDLGFIGGLYGMKCVEMREAAAKVLVKIGASAVPPLIAALQDERVWMRMTVVWVLGEMGDARAVEPLISLLKNKDSLRGTDCLCDCPRRAVLEALVKIGAPAIEPLVVLYEMEEVWQMHKEIAEALNELGWKPVQS